MHSNSVHLSTAVQMKGVVRSQTSRWPRLHFKWRIACDVDAMVHTSVSEALEIQNIEPRACVWYNSPSFNANVLNMSNNKKKTEPCMAKQNSVWLFSHRPGMRKERAGLGDAQRSALFQLLRTGTKPKRDSWLLALSTTPSIHPIALFSSLAFHPEVHLKHLNSQTKLIEQLNRGII